MDDFTSRTADHMLDYLGSDGDPGWVFFRRFGECEYLYSLENDRKFVLTQPICAKVRLTIWVKYSVTKTRMETGIPNVLARLKATFIDDNERPIE